MMTTTRMNRRQFFGTLGEGSLVVGFSLSPVAASILAGEAHAASVNSQLTILSGIVSGPPPGQNDAWLVIDHQGNITLFSGKVEIGTGTQTAFSQIVAEELHTSISKITYVQGDTSQTPDQGFTAGSKSIQVQGPLLRRAAATAYQALAAGQQGTVTTNPSRDDQGSEHVHNRRHACRSPRPHQQVHWDIRLCLRHCPPALSGASRPPQPSQTTSRTRIAQREWRSRNEAQERNL